MARAIRRRPTGAGRLHPGLRRRSGHRWPTRRRLRAQTCLPVRRRHVRRHLRGLCAGHHPGVPHRRTAPAGAGRRGDAAAGPGADPGHLPAGPRTRPRPRAVRRGHRCRGAGRADPRRAAGRLGHRRLGVADRVPGQCPAVRGDVRRRGAAGRGGPHGGRRATGPQWCIAAGPWPVRGGACAGDRSRARLDRRSVLRTGHRYRPVGAVPDLGAPGGARRADTAAAAPSARPARLLPGAAHRGVLLRRQRGVRLPAGLPPPARPGLLAAGLRPGVRPDGGADVGGGPRCAGGWWRAWADGRYRPPPR